MILAMHDISIRRETHMGYKGYKGYTGSKDYKGYKDHSIRRETHRTKSSPLTPGLSWLLGTDA